MIIRSITPWPEPDQTGGHGKMRKLMGRRPGKEGEEKDPSTHPLS
jgi:hypothetical protein